MNQQRILEIIAASGLSAMVFTGCSKSDEELWRDSNGTKGLINLEAVKTAYKKYRKVSDFEKRINEIYEGDNLVLLKSEGVKNGFKLSAYEDLDKDKKISPEKDDPLFTLTVQDGRCELKGMGKNSYYKDSWTYNVESERRYYRSHYHSGGFFFYSWYGYGSRWGGYYTPYSRYGSLYSSRNSYRGSSAFSTQVRSNNSFMGSMSRSKGTAFSATKTTSARQSYVKKTSGSSSFSSKLNSSKRSSGWGKGSTRSSFGSSGSFRSSSGSSI